MKLKIWITIYLATLVQFALVTPNAAAGEQNTYDRIQLTAQSGADVENDTMVAVLVAQRQGSDVGELASEVNQIMARAIKRCKQVKSVEVQTLDYHTSPVFEKQHQTGWRVSQSLQLKSQDSQALSHLLGKLQGTISLDSMHYEVSLKQLQKVKESLIAKAIAAFRKRAQNITEQLGRKHYRLVSMQVNTGGVPVQPGHPQMVRSFASARVAPPSIEAGKQRVTVSVSGEIELVLKN